MRIGEIAVVFAGHFSNHLLFEARERAERIDPPAVQIKLPFGDVAGIVGDRMGHIAAGHRRHGDDRDRAAPVDIDRFFIAGSQIGIERAWIAAVRRDLVHRDRDLFDRIGKGGHVGQQDEDIFILRWQIFPHRRGPYRGQGGTRRQDRSP